MLAWGGLRTVEEVLNITDNTVVVGMSPGSGRIAGLDMAYGAQTAEAEVALAEPPVLHAPVAMSAMKKTADGVAADGVSQDVVIRENLNETAFFYPRLMTDTSGVVALRFTLPESLTTWKFMLGPYERHDAGLLTDEVVAAKEVNGPTQPAALRADGRSCHAFGHVVQLDRENVGRQGTMEVFDRLRERAFGKRR